MVTTPDRMPADEDATARPRGPMIAFLVLGVLLVLGLLWFFLLSPDDDVADPAASAPDVVATPAPVETAAPAPGPKQPVETFEVFAPKDPFDPLVSAAAAGTGGEAAGATGTTDAGDGTTTTEGSGTDPGDGTGTTTTTGSGGTGGDDIGGHRVRVVDVFVEGGRPRAQIQVDGTVYTVDEGERFAQNFQLMSASGQCASILFGDDEFTLCEGEEILK